MTEEENRLQKLKSEEEEIKKPLNAYVNYSALAFQMIATIGLGAFAGHWLDEKLKTTSPWYTIGLCLLGVFISLWLLIRSIPKN